SRQMISSWVHPEAESQLSVVQEFSSSQTSLDPPTHCPSEQVSWVVQALPSSQEAVLGVCTQPSPDSPAILPITRSPTDAQWSSLHGVPSSQALSLLQLEHAGCPSPPHSEHSKPSGRTWEAPLHSAISPSEHAPTESPCCWRCVQTAGRATEMVSSG